MKSKETELLGEIRIYDDADAGRIVASSIAFSPITGRSLNLS